MTQRTGTERFRAGRAMCGGGGGGGWWLSPLGLGPHFFAQGLGCFGFFVKTLSLQSDLFRALLWRLGCDLISSAVRSITCGSVTPRASSDF